MGLLDRFMFKKDNSVAEEKPDAKATVGLYNEVAVNELVELMVKVPDIDEVLKQAGVPRQRLNVLMYDDEIAQAVETRLDALLGLSLHLEPTESEQTAFVEEQLKRNLNNIISGAFQARLFGYSVMEVVYKRTEDNKIGIDFVGEKPLHWFAPKPDGRLFYFKNGYTTMEGEEVDQKFKFIMTRNKATYANPYGEALLSRLYWPWFFRQNGWKFWGKFLERFGAPLLVGKSTDPQAMVRALLMAHSQAVMGVDREDSVEAIGPSGGNNGAAFDQFETAVIRRIQKVVLGQTLTSGTDGGSGNRALGQVHNNVRSDKLDSDIKLVLPAIQKTVDALVALNNFQPIEAQYSTETSLEEGRAARDKDLYAVGVRFKDTYFQDNYDLTTEDFEMSSGDPVDPPALPADVVPPAEKKPAKVKASKDGEIFELTFKKEPQVFTKDQQMVEDIGDEAIAKAGLPLDLEKIKAAVFAATDPDDLQERLMVLFAGDNSVSEEQFSTAVEEALRQVQILGYVQSET